MFGMDSCKHFVCVPTAQRVHTNILIVIKKPFVSIIWRTNTKFTILSQLTTLTRFSNQIIMCTYTCKPRLCSAYSKRQGFITLHFHFVASNTKRTFSIHDFRLNCQTQNISYKRVEQKYKRASEPKKIFKKLKKFFNVLTFERLF